MSTCAVPIYQLWGLGYNLEGSRFYFFLTLPISLLWSVIVFKPGPSNSQKSNNFWPTVVGISTLVVMVAVFERTAYANNTVWLKAGKCIRKSPALAIGKACRQDPAILSPGNSWLTKRTWRQAFRLQAQGFYAFSGLEPSVLLA